MKYYDNPVEFNQFHPHEVFTFNAMFTPSGNGHLPKTYHLHGDDLRDGGAVLIHSAAADASATCRRVSAELWRSAAAADSSAAVSSWDASVWVRERCGGCFFSEA